LSGYLQDEQMTSSHLAAVTHHPRVFGYLLAVLILTQLENAGGYVFGWMVVMLLYPQVLNRFLRKSGRRDLTRVVMSVDAVVTGLLISLVDFNFEAGVVLVSVLSVSIIIIGGFLLWVLLLPVSAAAMLLGTILHPAGLTGNSSFYFICFFCLVAYMCFVGVLVYQETHRLNAEQKHVQSIRNRLEKFRVLITPYVSPEFISSKGDLTGYARKRLSVLFVDLEGFTRLMDTADEFLVAGMLNRYFEVMTEVAAEYGGTINKFMGDGAMVFFGDARSEGAVMDAVASVEAAMEMRVRFELLSGQWQGSGGAPLHLRMGIHTGYCLLGNFGCAARRDYTALGSVVNLASRLEGLARRGEILISSDTRRLVASRIDCANRGQMAVKGFSEPVSTFSVNGLSGNTDDSPEVRLLS
jgi:adenylate cyclase